MPSCVYRKCTNYCSKINKTQEISYHMFPTNEIRLQEWIAIVRKQRKESDWVPSKASRICINHFKATDIYTSKKGRTLLRKNAVPVIQESESRMNKKEFNSEDLTCKPLDTYEEITKFLKDPPPWRTLCKDITPHSKNLIRNNEINPCTTATMQMPETFCHFNPDMEDVERHNEKNLPRTLVCHDMANGYHDDSVIDGTGNYNAYTFYNWAGIDIFCYFSHHLITIPPVSWINVGHAHGVKVIGTVITEWEEGITFWDKILSSEVEYQNFASALVAIAKTLKFDGWLLNVENRVTKPDVLLEFVKYLHTTLHQELRDPVLVWYDSVTVNGSLNWQNGLNEKNKAFFDVCDAFFTNYSWSESNIKSSVEAAGHRLTDLYIGIDVWGRNFYGGGQFNTAEAVKIAYKYGCSLAIFAPAWTHEAMSLDKGDVNAVAFREKADEWATFNLRDRAFWGSIWPFLNTRLPTELPFQTSFCRGQGKKRRLYGEVLCPVPWYNLRHQQYQPNSAHGPHGYILSTVDYILKIAQKEAYKGDQVDNELDETDEPGTSFKSSKSVIQMSVNINLAEKTEKVLAEKTEKVQYSLASIEEEKECLEVYMEDSFIGGSCLCINPSDLFSIEHRLIRLFHCDFECKDSLIACVVTKNLDKFKDQYLKIKLFIKNSKGDDIRVVLIGKNLPQSKNMVSEETEIVNLYPVNLRSQEAFRDLQRYVLLNEPTFYVPVENCYNWKVWYYEINMPGSRVTSVNCQTGLEQGPILLGHFGLCERFRK